MEQGIRVSFLFFILSFITSFFGVSSVFANAGISSRDETKVVEQDLTVVRASPTSFNARANDWPTKNTIQKSESLSTNPFDLLKDDPEVRATHTLNGNSSTMTVRGSQSVSRIRFLTDGYPTSINDGLGVNPILIPYENIKSTQTFWGPQNHVFGASSISGAVNFVTEDESDFDNRYAATVGVGSFGEKTLHGYVPFLTKSNSKYSISHLHQTIDGNYNYRWPGGESKFERKHNDTHTDRVHLKGEQTVGTTRFEETILLSQQFGSTPGAEGGDPSNKVYKAGLGGLTVTHPLQNSVVSNRTSFVNSDFQTKGFSDSEFDTTTTSSLNNTSLLLSEITTSLKTELTLDVNSTKFESDFYNEGLSQTEWELGNIWSWEFFKGNTLGFGSGYSFSYGRSTPTLSYVLDFGPKLWATYSEGFRAPPLTSKYGESDFYEGNPDLKPEKSSQVELGSEIAGGDGKLGFGSSWRLRASAYRILYDDLIQNETTDDSKFRPINVASAESKGFTLSGRYQYRLTEASLLFNQSQNQDLVQEIDLLRSPLRATTVQISQYWGALKLSVRNTSWTSYYISANERRDGWQVMDLFVETFGFQNFEARVGVDNVFDTSREISLGFPEPQRRYYLSFKRYF